MLSLSKGVERYATAKNSATTMPVFWIARCATQPECLLKTGTSLFHSTALTVLSLHLSNSNEAHNNNNNIHNKQLIPSYLINMGGDGGVIASNRRYMRGAGSAECTADHPRRTKGTDGPAANITRELMTTCALTKVPLEFGTQAIVACPFGFLYHKEAAVQALLRRREQQSASSNAAAAEDELGPHIRGLKDLYPVHFHLIQPSTTPTNTTTGQDTSSNHHRLVPACPVTGTELNGTMRALLLVSTDKKGNANRESKINVISERALKEMGMESLQAEFGPFDPNRMIRLAPLPCMMEQLQEELQKQREIEQANKKPSKNGNGSSSKKNSKKRHADEALVATSTSTKPTATKIHKTDTKTEQAAQVARDRASSAMQKSQVLSSLFTPN